MPAESRPTDRPTQSSHDKETAQHKSRYKRHSLAKFGVLWLGTFLTLMGFFLNRVLHSHNYLEIFPQEMILPTLMHAFTATLINLILFWCRPLKSFASKLLSAIILCLLFVGYDQGMLVAGGFIQAFMPGVTAADSTPVLSVMYLITLVLLAIATGVGYGKLQQKYPRIEHRNVWIGLLIVVSYLFVLPAFSVAKALPSMLEQSKVQAPEFATPATAKTPEGKPDIYYFVLDRYTNNEVLKDQFNFNNTYFLDFLKNHNFTVNNSAQSSYPYTTSSVASTLAADYTKQQVAPFVDNTVQSKALYHNLIWQSPVIKAIKKQGYRYYNFGTWYGATYKAPLAEVDEAKVHLLTVFGKEKRLRGIEFTEFETSPYFRLAHFEASWWPFKNANLLAHSNTVNQLNLLDYAATQDKPGGRFIFSHILVPHPPYYFNADGSLAVVPESSNVEKPVKAKYVNQIEYINSQMTQIIGQIKKQSGDNAVIIFSSDEGPYPQSLNDTLRSDSWASAGVEGDGFLVGDMRDWPDDWLQMKYGILQAAHIPKATSNDMKHMNSVNMFRIVLNRYFGYNLDYLPQCHLAFSNGGAHEFQYADVTKRLNPALDNQKYCEQMATKK